jgi:hypothetical protein
VAVAGALSLLLVAPHLSGTDLSAAAAHADFAAAHPLTPVDLRWYAGSQQFGYSLWSQYAMAALGVRTAGVLAALVSAAAFALLLRRAQARRELLGSLVGAACIVLNLASGRITYAIGLAVGLLALLALPRRLPAAVLTLLAAAASPVAGLFLGLAGAALLLTGRRADGLALALPAALALGVVGGLFGQGGYNAMSIGDTWTSVVLTVAAGLAVPHRAVRVGAVLLAFGLVAAYAVHTPVGLNAVRLPTMFAIPLVLAFAPWSALVVAPVVVALAVVRAPVQRYDVRQADWAVNTPAYFAPLTAELARRAPTGRVEAVPTVDYWEAVHVAEVAPLARGWLRQQDTLRNPLFFDGTLSAATYEAWLRDTGVQYVALPGGPLAFVGRAEGALVRGGLPYLSQVWSGGDWVLYEVAGSPALADGARVLRSTATQIALRVDAPADVLVRVQPSRWLTVTGPACLAPAGRWVRLRADRPGDYVISSALQLRPTAAC